MAADRPAIRFIWPVFIWGAAAAVWTVPLAAYAGVTSPDGGGWWAFGLLELAAASIGAIAALIRYSEPNGHPPGTGAFGTYETLLVSAAPFWGCMPAAVAGVWIGEGLNAHGLGWTAFALLEIAAALAAWPFARRTRGARRLHGWLVATGPAVVGAFALAAVGWNWYAARETERIMNERPRHWFPPIDLLFEFGAALGAVFAMLYFVALVVGCSLTALGAALFSLAGAWGRWVLNRRWDTPAEAE